MALRKPQHGAQRTSVPGSPSVQLEHELVGVAPEPVLTGLKGRSEEHTSELQSQSNLVCRLLLEKKKHSKGVGRINHKKALHIQPQYNLLPQMPGTTTTVTHPKTAPPQSHLATLHQSFSLQSLSD